MSPFHTVQAGRGNAAALTGAEQASRVNDTDESKPTPATPSLRGGALIRAAGFWKIVAEDLRTHHNDPFSAGFQAMFWYRFGTWADLFTFKPVRWPLMLAYVICQRFVQNVYGIELRRTSQLGRRVELAHQHGIVIHHLADIGDDVVIRHNVTFGIGSEWTGKGPRIGNRVSFSPGVVVMGDVTIGDDVSVGPNCTVTTDVPAGRTLFMPPPRSLPKKTGDTPNQPAGEPET